MPSRGSGRAAYAEEHWRTRPATMAVALGHLDASYGGAVGYLRTACGLTEGEIIAVRHRLTTPEHTSRGPHSSRPILPESRRPDE